MGASVVNVDLSPASWLKNKPEDYKDKKLETALKAAETAKGKLPKQVQDTISGLDAAIKAMKEFASAVDAASAAASAAAADMEKAKSHAEKAAKKAKDDDDEKKKQNDAASAYAGGVNYVSVLQDRLSKALASVK